VVKGQQRSADLTLLSKVRTGGASRGRLPKDMAGANVQAETRRIDVSVVDGHCVAMRSPAGGLDAGQN
jgi:hypothetical protein